MNESKSSQETGLFYMMEIFDLSIYSHISTDYKSMKAIIMTWIEIMKC